MARDSTYARGHKETSETGKWDPGGYSMDTMRSDLAKKLSSTSGDDDEVKPTDVVGKDSDGTDLTMGEMSARVNWLYQQFLEAGSLNEQLDRIEQKLDALK